MAASSKASRAGRPFVALLEVLTIFHVAVDLCGAKTTNLALNKPTLQSSTDSNGTSSRAVDGNRDSYYFNNSCSHTIPGGRTAWFQVDLGGKHYVTHVQITNRGEEATVKVGQRLRNFTVETSLEDPKTLPGFPDKKTGRVCVEVETSVPDGATATYHCRPEVFARYVRVVKYDLEGQALTICELEVFDLRRWNSRRAEEFTSTARVTGTTGIIPGLRSKLECAKECTGKTGEACRVAQFHVPTGRCELLESTKASDKANTPDWQVYVFDQYHD